MFEIKRYSAADRERWDNYVRRARNATFLFERNYMEYHADRFDDYSLMFYRQGRLYALLPAHRCDSTLVSHFGLTYGGLLMDIHVTISDTCQLFTCLNSYLRCQGFTRVLYRPVPWVYHIHPSEEDLYAIFWQCNAHLYRRNIGTAISMCQHLPWRKDHQRRLHKAHAAGVTVKSNADLSEFWPILEDNLRERFDATPVHTLNEILLLQRRFPDNIIQYSAYRNGHIIGGITFYISKQVIHGQYSATNDEGKEFGAMEAIYEQVMYHDYKDMEYLDFGSSTEADCSVINAGLIAHKEGYGGRGVVYDTYEWQL